MRSAVVLLILSFALLWPREWPGDEKVERRPLNAVRATSLDELFSPEIQTMLQSPDSVTSYLLGGLVHTRSANARDVPEWRIRQDGPRLSRGQQRTLSTLLLQPSNYHAAHLHKPSVFLPDVGYTVHAGADSVVVLVTLGDAGALITSGDVMVFRWIDPMQDAQSRLAASLFSKQELALAQ
jgi:hypothetical protein